MKRGLNERSDARVSKRARRKKKEERRRKRWKSVRKVKELRKVGKEEREVVKHSAFESALLPSPRLSPSLHCGLLTTLHYHSNRIAPPGPRRTQSLEMCTIPVVGYLYCILMCSTRWGIDYLSCWTLVLLKRCNRRVARSTSHVSLLYYACLFLLNERYEKGRCSVTRYTTR